MLSDGQDSDQDCKYNHQDSQDSHQDNQDSHQDSQDSHKNNQNSSRQDCQKSPGWSESGWDIPREPGSQAPTKSSGSHEMLAEIYAPLSQT